MPHWRTEIPGPGAKASSLAMKKRFWEAVRNAQIAAHAKAIRGIVRAPVKKKVVKKKATPKKVAKKAIKPKARPQPASRVAKAPVVRTLPPIPERHGIKARRTVQGQLPANRLIYEKA